MKLMARKRLLVTILVMALITMFAVPLTAFAATGTVWTTDSLNSIQDQNQYDDKQDVYFRISGFPDQDPDSSDTIMLYVQVTAPGGEALSDIVPLTESTSEELSFHLWSEVTYGGNPGYADTTNEGGSYKLSVSTNDDMSNSKSDNFKVRSSTEPNEGISIKKSVLPTTVSALDVDVTYTFEIENTGDVDFYNVIVYDEAIGVNLDLGALAAGDVTTAAVTFNLINLGTDGYGDWEGNKFTNTATATGYFGEEGSISDEDSATLTYEEQTNPQGPSINLVKSVSPGTVTSRSADITYTFTVTNNGDTQLYNVSLEDPSIGYLWDIGDLEIEATTTASVVFDLANVAGAWTSFTNVATVSAITQNEDTIYDSDSATVTFSSGGDRDRDRDRTIDTTTNIPNEPTPAGPVAEEPILEEEIPAAPLPQTGGIPSLLLYGLGALLAGGGATLKLRNRNK